MLENTKWNNRTFECPYCKSKSTFSCEFSVFGKHEGFLFPISVWRCHYCDKGIFIKHQKAQYVHEAQEGLVDIIYPSNEPEVDKRVPAGIADDYIEASKCFNISANKASVVMARRVIQKMCVNLGADKTKKLFQQIDELKKAGKLHPDLADIATEVRFIGNDGAHPEDDGLDQVKEEDAKEILDFTLELLDDLYVRPEKVKEMKNRRATKSSSGKKS
jgi:DNA-directed RNA polymerase subunit RPC12/RpoP